MIGRSRLALVACEEDIRLICQRSLAGRDYPARSGQIRPRRHGGSVRPRVFTSTYRFGEQRGSRRETHVEKKGARCRSADSIRPKCGTAEAPKSANRYSGSSSPAKERESSAPADVQRLRAYPRDRSNPTSCSGAICLKATYMRQTSDSATLRHRPSSIRPPMRTSPRSRSAASSSARSKVPIASGPTSMSTLPTRGCRPRC